MDVLSDFLPGALIVIAVAPLVLVGVLALAHYLEWSAFDRILDATRRALEVQWVVGGLVNILLGLALMAGGGWLAWRSTSLWSWVMAPLVLVFGLWRITRGVDVLKGFRK